MASPQIVYAIKGRHCFGSCHKSSPIIGNGTSIVSLLSTESTALESDLENVFKRPFYPNTDINSGKQTDSVQIGPIKLNVYSTMTCAGISDMTLNGLVFQRSLVGYGQSRDLNSI